MPMLRRTHLVFVLVAAGMLTSVVLTTGSAGGRDPGAEPPKTVEYNRDVRAILSRRCFACHGPDDAHRESSLRLDTFEGATTEETDYGLPAIVPGDASASELIRRITSEDAGERMPPEDMGEPLSDEEIAILRAWIDGGAAYEDHWAFVPVRRPPLPAVQRPEWTQSPLDYFILARLEGEGLEPAPPADRVSLIRRLSLDLRGLPPSPAEVDAFLADTRPDAWERLVDRLLQDPAYGERWAQVWLDLARFADSRGYGSDPLRTNMWRYRDWVIDAFNRNLPYDQFTIEQLAADLLPEPTLDQQVATAFHRNTMTNTEGGTDDEEFRVAAVQDRVDTTMLVWMGLTMGCAKCHDHKYDPLSQREYYELFAVFNQTEDADRPDEAPVMPAPGYLDALAQAEHAQRLAAAEQQLARMRAELEADPEVAEGGVPAGRIVRVELPGNNRILSLAEVQVVVDGENVATGGEARQSSTAYEGPASLAVDGNTDGHYFEARSTTHTETEADPWWEVDLGTELPIESITIWNRTDGTVGARLEGARVLILDGDRQTVWSESLAAYPNPSLEVGPRTLGPRAQAAALQEQEVNRLRESAPQIPTLPVMRELSEDQKRPTHVMIRGSFLQPGEEVMAGVPQRFHPPPSTGDAPVDRLAVAEWLMDPQNPLTARVAVNRVWSRIFGLGLVETEEDFGTQGTPPSHPKLLDWLADEYQSNGWDTKQLVREIVCSATYRQSARVTPQLLERDPRNRLLSRSPRYRLPAETLRDQALKASGLLSRSLHGPSVYPYQPPGLWRAAFNGQRTWPVSEGEDRYRRGLYTFLRRTVPYPSMAALDAPSREWCTVRRIRTNTPLQAFVMMNDPVFVEAAQALARRTVAEGGSDDAQRLDFACRQCWGAPPTDRQRAAFMVLLDAEREALATTPAAAVQLATDPLGPVPPGADAVELAAWTVLANILLNTDRMLTRP